MAETKTVQYGDKQFPMGDMTLDQAKSVMARHFPELANPKIDTKKDGDNTIYVFTKQAGQKGAGDVPAGNVPAVIQALQQVPRFELVPAQIMGQVMARQLPTISESALDTLTTACVIESRQVQEAAERLQALPAAWPTQGAVLL